jgi:hypothetical protein
MTADGGASWTDVTPPQLGPWWKVFMIDAGHFDRQTAYAAVNTLRLDDMRPHMFRTRDGGRTWTDVSPRVPDCGGPANALREDPKKRGLLYAATERGVCVSFDDGAHWQSLQLNLPHTSIRDLIVKDDDIAVGTHGRGFWILDDVTPLRQMDGRTSSGDALFRPTTALRVRWNENTDTPLPPDEPMAENPPEGAAIDYRLASDASGPVTLEIIDARGRVVRRYASTDSLPWKIPPDSTTPLPRWWYRAPQVLSARGGFHRFYWDVHYQPLSILARRTNPFGDEALPISATPYNTAPAPNVPFVAAGNYTVRLTANGRTYTQPITVRQDPRVRTSAAAMREVYALTDTMYFTMRRLEDAIGQAVAVQATDSIQRRVREVLDAPAPPDTSRRGGPQLGPNPAAAANATPPPPGPNTLRGAVNTLAGLLMTLQQADTPATATERAAIADALRSANGVIARWNALRGGLSKTGRTARQ